MRSELLNRREFLAAGFTAVCCPAPVAAQASDSVTPELFGAVGDGVSDDFDAFSELARTVTRMGGGNVSLRPSATYFLDRYMSPGNGVTDIMFEGCTRLTIDGNGAAIRMKGDIHRSTEGVRGLTALWFENCNDVTVRDLELDGGFEHMTRAPGLREAATYGLLFRSCSDVAIENVHAHHFATDGMLIRESAKRDATGKRRASRHFRVSNSRFVHNGRQGLSITQLRDGLFDECDFSYTGFSDTSGGRSPYGAHSPAAGVDVEPNNTPEHNDLMDVLTGDILFSRCRMQSNYGPAFLASKHRGGKPFLERVRLQECLLECNDGETAGRDGFIFDVPAGEVVGCTLQMRDKSAYFGWYRNSSAMMRFAWNTVHGRNSGPHRRFFALRPTRGTALVERNRFVGQHSHSKAIAGSHVVFLDNPNAVVRNNNFFIPAALFPSSAASGILPAVYANAGVIRGNSYVTDLRSSDGAHFAIMYTRTCDARDEWFRGTAPGYEDTIRPGSHEARVAYRHDTRLPWSRPRGERMAAVVGSSRRA